MIFYRALQFESESSEILFSAGKALNTDFPKVFLTKEEYTEFKKKEFEKEQKEKVAEARSLIAIYGPQNEKDTSRLDISPGPTFKEKEVRCSTDLFII